MRTGSVIVALLVVAVAGTSAQSPRWHVDAGASTLVEAWNRNESLEELAGPRVGIDRTAWRGVAVRAEGLLLNVTQRGTDGWVRGFLIGTRARWTRPFGNPFVDVAVGLSDTTVATPPRGTRFNYLAMSGAGLEVSLGAVWLEMAVRWLHLSNNGREGRQRNPDIQALGPSIALGWKY